MIRQAFKDLNRLREISLVAARHGFGEMLDRSRLWEILGRRESAEERPESKRESTARRFRLLLGDLGPTFIKLGQILSTRPDLLPAEYIEELAKLQDAVPPEPMDHVLVQIEESFGRPVTEVFREIEPTALASASIAQVHRAVTLEGEEVVVKVQRPRILERVSADLDLLYYAARLLEAVVEETGVYTPTGIIEEFDRAIREELDFINEANNIREFYRNYKDRPALVIPKVYDALSGRTVLTLQFLRGEKISLIEPDKHDRKALATTLVDNAFRQLFEDGLFHGDPHPGNILVLADDRLGLLDFGVVGRVTKQMQENLVLLVMAVSLKDADTVARLLYRVATPDHRANLGAFKADIQQILDRYLKANTELKDIEAARLVPELLNLAVKYRIRIPKEYAILSRASVAMEGILRWLYPQLNVGEVALPYAKELLVGRYETGAIGGVGLRTLLRLQTLATDLPMQLSQILIDLEGGKFHVNVHIDELSRVNASIKMLGLVGFMGLLACGLTIGAFISFSRIDREVSGVPLLGGLAVLLIGMLFGTALTWTFLLGRVRKISLSRLMKRRR
jgi:ubiquinone biosynthesis protein